jgi:FkbM family methyltransferase
MEMTMLNRLRNFKEARYFLKYGEIEMHLIKHLCHPLKDALDIGANVGGYVHFMRRYARSVVAYEPNPDFVAVLRKKFAGDEVKIQQLALSDREDDNVLLTMPIIQGETVSGCATISFAAATTFGGMCKSVVCRSARLDGVYNGEVGFIKIDVEGNEMAVLDGAFETISMSRPNVLVEIDDHLSPGGLQEAIRYFLDHNYRGFYIWKKSVVLPAESFSVRLSQDPANRVNLTATLKYREDDKYLSNFLFLPAETAFPLCVTIQNVLKRL